MSGTNQPSVSLSATFDAIGFAEGYNLVVTMQEWETQGSPSNDVSVLPGGPALALAAHVVWTSDYTASPSTQTATTSGPFGGNATLHLTLTAPQNLWGGAATASVRVHEVAASDASGDLVFTNLPLYGSPSAVCGEPASSPPPYSTQCYLDVPWNAGGFNGAYTVTATVLASVGGSATPQTVSLDSPLTVDREDLLITGTSPANPTPLKWDPSANNGNPAPVTVSATLNSVAYKASGTATLNIYSSDQTLVRTLTQPFVTTDRQVVFSWDGNGEGPKDGQGNPVLDTNGNPVPGPVQDKGIYLFQFNLSSSIGDSDMDKSQALSFGVPATALSLQVGTIDAAGEIDTLGYTLADMNNIVPYACQLDVYENWDFRDLVPEKSIPAALGSNTVTFYVPPPSQPSEDNMTQGTKLVYLVSSTDADSGHDKGHRKRVALQHNAEKRLPTLLTWGGYYPVDTTRIFDPFTSRHTGVVKGQTGGQADHADKIATKLGYNLWRARGDWPSKGISDVTPQTILFQDLPAQYADPPDNKIVKRYDCPQGLLAYCIDVAIFVGHGANGNAFMFGLAPQNDLNVNYDKDYLLVTTDGPTQTYWEGILPYDEASENFWALSQASPNVWGAQAYTDPITQKQKIVPGVSLIIWAACDTASDFHGTGLPQATVALGANCSIGLQTAWRMSDVTALLDWLASKDNYFGMQNTSQGQTVYQALHHAVIQQQIELHFPPISADVYWKKYAGIAVNTAAGIDYSYALPTGK